MNELIERVNEVIDCLRTMTHESIPAFTAKKHLFYTERAFDSHNVSYVRFVKPHTKNSNDLYYIILNVLRLICINIF